MHKPTFASSLLASAIALALTACGGSGGDDPVATQPAQPAPQNPPAAAEPGEVYVLTASNKIVTFNRDTPGTIRTTATVTGLQPGENLIGIDFRPADGQLYGVGSSGRIYTIVGRTGAATLKSTLAADPADTSAPFTALAGTEFGVDFNPAADRLRVVSNTGQSLRINVDNGVTATDGNLNGGPANTAVTAAGYTNSFAGAATTTLYVIDPANTTLFIQNPTTGALSAPVALGAFSQLGGFDIDARTNTGYTVMTVGGTRGLYAIDLAASANPVTRVGALAINEELRGLTLRSPNAPLVHGLGDDGRLLSFKASSPNTIDANVAITGLATGERLLGIDIRPKDGLLYGLTSNARIVTINPATGAASVKASMAADPADTSAPFTALAGTAFAADFNPAADRLRVIGNTGQNLRINVDTGATSTDTPINRSGAAPAVTGAAYTNSFAGATSTTLFDLDTAGASLAVQNPPNDGALANVGALGVSIAGDVGMDIAGGANGLVLAALRTSATGPSSLYRIDLATGAATLVNGAATPAASAIGSGATGLTDIAIAITPR
ncbi:DNA polymerase I [Massilia sp. KIM]|uniref:DUF4394 domain-containing protein n=1 Tax=Massilia sp. KIM TaxID=1955422 RepID=UPI00098F9292|nr:DUF4394 domain-containing protein [Massilia sp. KIM]OON63917.1 DNA polymerase I [Massilia sp. KIM]